MNKRIYPKLHADFGENGKAGFVNAEGDFVISPIWEYAYDFHNGLGEVIDHRKNCRFVDIEGKLYDSHHLSRKEVVKIRNGNGKIREYEKNHYDLYPYEDMDGKEGYVNSRGQIVIPCKYHTVDNQFSEGLAWVYDKENNMGAYINTKGEVAFTHNYYTDRGKQSVFSNGLALVEAPRSEWDNYGGHFGYINACGEVVIPFEFSYACRFSEERAFIRNLDGYWGIIDTKGNCIVPCIYTAVDGVFENGTAWVRIEWKWRLIDRNGNFISKDSPLAFECAETK